MKIAVMGTGMVGSAIAGKLKSLGHDVVFGSRSPGEARDGIQVLSHADAARHGEWLVNALPGEQVVKTFTGLEVDGKVLVDIGNYDHAVDQPIVEPLGQLIQRSFPKLQVVKTLNCVSAHLMVDPQSLGAVHTVFVASDHAEAKLAVTALLRDFGWQHIQDLGDLAASRATEQLVPLWMRLEEVLGGPNFNLALVTGPQPKKD